MRPTLFNNLRAHRLVSGLSQEDVAYLAGELSGQSISRYERMLGCPSLSTAFVYQVIFDVAAEEMFSGMHQKVEQLTIWRIIALNKELAELPQGPAARSKQRMLQEALARCDMRRK